MLRTLLAVFLVSMLVACARKDQGRGLLTLTGTSPSPELQGEDSTYYIGYVDYFPETHEFYTALSYREGFEYPDEDLLESKLDSTIIFDDDWGRERLPIEDAQRILVLEGLDTLAIFNRRHDLICKCPLTRIEYVWNGLESYFIAVFKANKDFPGQTEELYGISASLPEKYFTSFSTDELEDETFNNFLLGKLKVPVAGQWEMRHYRVTPPEAMYSVLSSWSSSGSRSYLTFFERNKAQILNEEVDNFHYLNILPVPIFVNDKPLMLISAGYPSSDVLWDYLAVFDGTRYEAVEYNRIRADLVSVRPAVNYSVTADAGPTARGVY
jgi:hypothetical protein